VQRLGNILVVKLGKFGLALRSVGIQGGNFDDPAHCKPEISQTWLAVHLIWILGNSI
jgi:hypothetical protein